MTGAASRSASAGDARRPASDARPEPAQISGRSARGERAARAPRRAVGVRVPGAPAADRPRRASRSVGHLRGRRAGGRGERRRRPRRAAACGRSSAPVTTKVAFDDRARTSPPGRSSRAARRGRRPAGAARPGCRSRSRARASARPTPRRPRRACWPLPGPVVTIATPSLPGGARVAVGGVRGGLLVADADEPDRASRAAPPTAPGCGRRGARRRPRRPRARAARRSAGRRWASVDQTTRRRCGPRGQRGGGGLRLAPRCGELAARLVDPGAALRALRVGHGRRGRAAAWGERAKRATRLIRDMSGPPGSSWVAHPLQPSRLNGR